MDIFQVLLVGLTILTWNVPDVFGQMRPPHQRFPDGWSPFSSMRQQRNFEQDGLNLDRPQLYQQDYLEGSASATQQHREAEVDTAGRGMSQDEEPDDYRWSPFGQISHERASENRETVNMEPRDDRKIINENNQENAGEESQIQESPMPQHNMMYLPLFHNMPPQHPVMPNQHPGIPLQHSMLPPPQPMLPRPHPILPPPHHILPPIVPPHHLLLQPNYPALLNQHPALLPHLQQPQWIGQGDGAMRPVVVIGNNSEPQYMNSPSVGESKYDAITGNNGGATQYSSTTNQTSYLHPTGNPPPPYNSPLRVHIQHAHPSPQPVKTHNFSQAEPSTQFFNQNHNSKIEHINVPSIFNLAPQQTTKSHPQSSNPQAKSTQGIHHIRAADEIQNPSGASMASMKDTKAAPNKSSV